MLRNAKKSLYLNLLMASWTEILVAHIEENGESRFMRLPSSTIASTALPGKTTHVYTHNSTHMRVTLILGKAADIRYLSSLRKHHHQVNAPKLLRRSTKGKGRRENVVTI